MYERRYERDLDFDLLTTQLGGGRQGSDLFEGARNLLYGFDQRRTLQRPLSRIGPQTSSLLDYESLGIVTRQ